MSTFKFSMQQRVTIEITGESGVVIGRAEYSMTEPSYYLRYQAADGRATEEWWAESALKAS